MILSRAILALTLAVLAAPALACGPGECEPPPPPPPPPVVIQPGDSDRDPAAPYVAIQYGYCCAVDGQPRVSVPFGRDRDTALAQCRERILRLDVLPACPKPLADRIRTLKGGE